MLSKSYWWKTALAVSLAGAAWGGTFGTVVSIGGEAADLALDSTRGVLYIANFTANRIDVMSLANNTIQTSINVAAQPNSIALSPDAHYLVATNFGNGTAPGSPANAVTVIDLTTNGQQTFALGSAPLGVAFGIDGLALIATSTDFLLLDPASGTTEEIDTLADVVAKTLPVPPANFPADISAASVVASADGLTIYGLGGSTSTVTFRYDVNLKAIFPGGVVTSTGILGPRVVSLNSDGSEAMAGWVMVNTQGTFVNYFPQHTNQFSVGTTLFDDSRGLLYAQIPQTQGETPTLMLVDSSNLMLHQRLNLPENLTGKSVLSPDSNTMYAVSASGVTVLPVGSLNQQPRVQAQQEDVVFRGSFCNQGVANQQVTIVDPGGNNTPFSISSDTNGVNVSPSYGVTPAVVTVSADPAAFLGQTGTVAATLTISSGPAVNVIPSVRVLVNNPTPQQRGAFIDIPGTLTDLLADPKRSQFYVLRSDKNQVQVFNSSNDTLMATLPTGNQPSTMAISYDQQYLLVGNQGSQIVNMYDLDTLQAQPPLLLPSGFVALSIASSANATLAQAEYYDGTYHILQLNLGQGTGIELPSLGVYNNVTNANTVMTASPNGNAIFIAQADGTVYLYDANSNSFVASRQDYTSLSGAYAASAFNQYVVGNHLLDSSLVPVMDFETGTGNPSGFAFVDQTGYRTTAPAPAAGVAQSTAPGVIQSVDMTNPTGSVSQATQMVEAPLLGTTTSPFTRTVAPLYDRSAILNLTVSGVTVLPWNFAASVTPPNITSVVNAADFNANVAPGGLISVFGTSLSPTNMASSELPLPTALANSCLSVNGQPVPILFVSPNQANAQMPYEAIGNVTLVFRTPGGTSDNFNLVVQPNAPSVFQVNAGPLTNVPTIVRNDNGQLVTDSNPVHRQSGVALVIYLTGLGPTAPAVADGMPAPSNPLSVSLTVPAITLGGVDLPLLYSGLAPGLVGVDQINVSVPFNVPTGTSVPLVITQGTLSYSTAVRVVN
ncbi:MAG TPA: hypothetical protein VMB25_14195 [Bryobacteraceae bacterium]|nr:hypothetical protein [Bryobacteraceae bacterium]